MALEKFIRTYDGYRDAKISPYGVGEVQIAKDAIKAYNTWLKMGTIPISTDVYCVRHSCIYALSQTAKYNKNILWVSLNTVNHPLKILRFFCYTETTESFTHL